MDQIRETNESFDRGVEAGEGQGKEDGTIGV
jgi:hypothetical protein